MEKKKKKNNGSVCAVLHCRNSSFSRKDLSFHTFPADQKIRKQWVIRCRRTPNWNCTYSKICSEHFEEDDFLRDLKAELLQCPSKRRLKPGVLPHVNLSKEKDAMISESAAARNHRMSTKLAREKHEEIINALLNAEVSLNNQVHCATPHQPFAMPEQPSTTLEEPSTTPEEPSATLEEPSPPKPDFESLYREVRLENEELKKEVVALRMQLSKLSSRANDLELHANILAEQFTPNEISLLSGKKKRINWTVDEITKAFTLRYLSKRTYVYLRKQLHHPLPGISTLKEWAANLDLRHGIPYDILRGLSESCH